MLLTIADIQIVGLNLLTSFEKMANDQATKFTQGDK
jgi:hypothetical protein